MCKQPPDSSTAERSDLVLAFARVLHGNGQSTHQTLAAVQRLSGRIGLGATLIPNWGSVQLQATGDGARIVSLAAATPAGVNMLRVASAMQAIENIVAGRLPLAIDGKAVEEIAQAPAAPTW